ncbi:SDR family oxidoreductase [Pseudarthrobacter oxydans]|uniref:SDR family oxidoreductase n=1 Tax=Pseudarthrobacter oxydans TaxID=1671 RepID=UPI003813EBA5
MDLQLEGIKVVITAGAAGLGFEIASQLLQEGAEVAILDVDTAAVDEARLALPHLHAAVCDISDRSAVSEAVRVMKADLGGVDVLINNAGISGNTSPIQDADPDDWEATLGVNLTGTFNVTRAVVPHLLESPHGSILNISSVAGLHGFPHRAPYSASKWGIIGLTKTLSIELGTHGIRVNALCPGSLDSPRGRRVINALAVSRSVPVAEIEESVLSKMAIKKFVPLAEVARMACFLASPVNTTLTGQVIAVDGNTLSMA